MLVTYSISGRIPNFILLFQLCLYSDSTVSWASLDFKSKKKTKSIKEKEYSWPEKPKG